MPSVNKHHIIPVSRGGKNIKNNTAVVDKQKHDLYHQLFREMKPDEIITFLVMYFWRNQWYWVDKAKERQWIKKKSVQRNSKTSP